MWLLLAVLAFGGCNRQPDGQLPEPQQERSVTLATSLEVEVAADVVRLTLHVTNPTTAAVRLEFPSAQRYDFAVLTTGGEEVWRWSADQMFAQVVGTETVPPSGTLRYRAEWRPGGRKGAFVALGVLTAQQHRSEQRSEFEVGREEPEPPS